MEKIALVSCTKKKQSYLCEAQEMYMPSTLFMKIITYIKQSNFDNWFMLSAKYGLLKKNTFIFPYDVTLIKMSSNERKTWANKVFVDIQRELQPQTEIYFFAGEKYRQYLLPLLQDTGFSCHVPLRGLQIGEQLSFLNNQIEGK